MLKRKKGWMIDCTFDDCWTGHSHAFLTKHFIFSSSSWLYSKTLSTSEISVLFEWERYNKSLTQKFQGQTFNCKHRMLIPKAES